ncbi:MAG: hypothetical protein A2939_03525 [Parcubacteria group bacterium RIFCSPLOWO2_01_FULL_48_18]|nr:MAG: hypothetical protein A2939_03525 [Parcubacteria group bacterium RIFCSPLOWO2_01_FULL_48_18]OHB23120.1 MAG: hypothetical protein A3J67_03145 [Parcubacteria group bacterium RIFCSPHIGHO2_02_FULL_48_10b]
MQQESQKISNETNEKPQSPESEQTDSETIPEAEQISHAADKKDYVLSASIFISAIILAGAWVYTTSLKYPQNSTQVQSQTESQTTTNELEEKLLPSEGIVLPVRWGNLGAKMISAGMIDEEKFEELYASRGGLDGETRKLLYGESNGNLKITSENSGIILNLLWALGLGTKNDVLETGPMNDPQYGGAGNFASTGGWTLTKGDVMTHYSQHPFVVLNREQQELVERAAKNIYRPCCNNSTHFPDCNHGMAMLGLLELMASQGISEKEMYKVALQVNSFWFPDTYIAIAQYLESKGTDWTEANPKELLGYDFSSAAGYRQILSQVNPPERKSSGGCGV